METELIEKASNEIAEYSKTEAGMAELRSRLENVTYDVTTVKGLAVAKADRAEVRGLRTGLEAMRKSIKAPAIAHCKLIDAEAKRLTDELLKLETPIDEVIKLRETELEAERAAREAAEKARVMAITERIAGIRQYVELAASCRTAERIQSLQDKLAEIVIEGFGEFQEEAESAWKQAGEKVEALLTAKLEHEAEQARIKAEQEAAAAQLKAEREAFAAEQAKAKAEADHQKALQDAAAASLAAERRKIAEEKEQMLAEKMEVAQAESDRLAVIAAAEKAEADRIEDLQKPKTVTVRLVESSMFATEVIQPQAQVEQAPVAIETAAPACCDPDGICTDACSNKLAEPSDGDLIWTAQTAIAAEYGMTTQQAFNRLKAIDWSI